MKSITFDLYEHMKLATMSVKKDYGYKLNLKNRWRVYLGLWLIEIGCHLTGISFEESEE
jgi:hypothetical protein